MKINNGLLAVFLAVFIWGATYVVTKIGLGSIGPNTLGFLRGVLGSIFLLSILIFQHQLKEFIDVIRKNVKAFAMLGFIGITSSMVFQNLALIYTTSALFSIILSTTTPIFIALISILFFREKFSKLKVLGLILGFVGVAVVLVNKEIFTGIGGFLSIIGQVLSLATSIVWAIYSVQNKHYSKNISAIFLTAGAYIFGTLFLAPIAFLFESPLAILNFSATSWAIILFLGIVSSGVAFLLWAYGFTKVEASKAGMFMYLIPVISLLLGQMLLGETLTAQAIVGSIIILSGVALVGKE
jgi:drug/metabolite transporter (DMT)-like permease